MRPASIANRREDLRSRGGSLSVPPMLRSPARRATIAVLISVALSGVAEKTYADPPRTTVMVIPFRGKSGPIGDLGYAIHLRALGVLHALSGLNIIHPKQLNRVLEHHQHRLYDLENPGRRKEIAAILGADLVLSGTLVTGARHVEIRFTVQPQSGDSVLQRRVRAPTLPEALDGFTPELTSALTRLGAHATKAPAAETITPATTSMKALAEYASCYRTIIEQPIGIRTPRLLDARRIDSAIRLCHAALRIDGKLTDAKAALGFLYALKGDQRSSERYLAAAKGSKTFLPLYWVGKFWVASRHYDVDTAVDALEGAIRKHPGFLLGRGYLGDTLIVLKRYEAARSVFMRYLDAVPRQPWVMGRIGYVNAKLGDIDAAITWTKKALSLAPADSELLLELASRHVDAGAYPEAISILKRLVAEGRARGEVHLRLGYAYLKTGDLPRAERAFRVAISTATALAEWRTRGRARYDLAKMWMQTDFPANALRELEMAIEEGFRDRAVFENDPDFKPLLANAEFQKLMRGSPRASPDLPRYASPFRLDPESGRIDLPAPASPQKRKTVILTF